MTDQTNPPKLAALSTSYSVWKIAGKHPGYAFSLVEGHEPPVADTPGMSLRAAVAVLESAGETVQTLMVPRDREHSKIPLSYRRVKQGHLLDIYKVKGGVPNTTMFLVPKNTELVKDVMLAFYRRTAMPPDTAWAVFRLINRNVE